MPSYPTDPRHAQAELDRQLVMVDSRGHGRDKRSIRALAGLACSGLLLLALPAPAAAGSGLPGANGKIAFTSDRESDGYAEIYTMDTNGADQMRLTNNRRAIDGGPAWSPDGSKIAFISNRDGNLDIYTMNADGTDQTRLTRNSGDDAFPAWSPDGTRIAITRRPAGEFTNLEIYTMNADGSDQTRLTSSSAVDRDPAWSPDGRKIAFASNRDGNEDIYTLNAADGAGLTNLTKSSAGDDGDPAWSPDGTRIAFTSYRDYDGNNFEIYSMYADGSDQTRLIHDTAHDRYPAWSPDGKKIAFASDRNGNEDIYTMNADGAGQTRLTVMEPTDILPAWQPLPNDLAVQASVNNSMLNIGGQATYTFRVTNNGAAPAPGASFGVTSPGLMGGVSAAPSQGTCQMGAIISCFLGTLGASASATVSVTGRATGAGTATATGVVSAWGADADRANNIARATALIAPDGAPAPADSVVNPSAPADLVVPATAPGSATTPTISLRVTYPRGLTSGKKRAMRRRALYRAIVKGFRGRVTGAASLQGSLVRERGRRCRHVATRKNVSCATTSRQGMRLKIAGASATFRYRPLRSTRRARRALRSGERLKKGTYRLSLRAFPSSGEPKLFRFKIRAT